MNSFTCKPFRRRSVTSDVMAREYTINLRKMVYGIGFKRRAPRVVCGIRKFTERAMGTKDVRFDPLLNKVVWMRGIKNPPRRIRVRISRKRNLNPKSSEKLYSYVEILQTELPKGLHTVVCDNQ